VAGGAIKPMMPQGVEHNLICTLAGAFYCDQTYDAARR